MLFELIFFSGAFEDIAGRLSLLSHSNKQILAKRVVLFYQRDYSDSYDLGSLRGSRAVNVDALALPPSPFPFSVSFLEV